MDSTHTDHSKEYKHGTKDDVYGDPFTVKMEAFFREICMTGGSIPDCTGCKDHVKGMGCTHKSHPMNVALEEVAK